MSFGKVYDTLAFEFRSGQYEECMEHAKDYVRELRGRELRPELYVQSCWELIHQLQIMRRMIERDDAEGLTAAMQRANTIQKILP